jgi:pantoate--beta-alanine ligase
VSIFVNPLQFTAGEDFEKYPRVFEKDLELLQELKVDYVFHPEASELYPKGFTTSLEVGDIGKRLCGAYRPGHFNGVATVCAKFFNITQASFAVFGEKDFQQLQVIKKMVDDLNLPIEIVAHPTVREPSGLALSSRNRYLSQDEQTAALAIPNALKKVRAYQVAHPDCSVKEITELACSELSGLKLQYTEITTGEALHLAHPSDLVRDLEKPRFFVAAFSGTTRLIDNCALSEIWK